MALIEPLIRLALSTYATNLAVNRIQKANQPQEQKPQEPKEGLGFWAKAGIGLSSLYLGYQLKRIYDNNKLETQIENAILGKTVNQNVNPNIQANDLALQIRNALNPSGINLISNFDGTNTKKLFPIALYFSGNIPLWQATVRAYSTYGDLASDLRKELSTEEDYNTFLQLISVKKNQKLIRVQPALKSINIFSLDGKKVTRTFNQGIISATNDEAIYAGTKIINGKLYAVLNFEDFLYSSKNWGIADPKQIVSIK